MAKRGKVLRDPNSGPGLLMVDGQQYSFVLEGVWRSEIPPKPGLVVEVELSAEGNVLSVTAVPESQLAKEQAEAAMAVAKEKGAAIASSMVAKFGLPSLVAAGLLIVGWFFLSAVSIKSPFGSLDFTFWQVLGFLNSSNAFEGLMQGGRQSSASPGIYGVLAVAAIAGPFIHHFWKDKRAILGGLLPLLFMIIVAIMINSSINSIGGEAGGMFGDMVKQMRAEIMKAITVGLGVYLSVVVSLYFAAISTKKFLAAGA
ncbi:MAG: hypothetical protein JST79_21330 [Acidobacteria bacterium]|jgi:hypothetical protein|nr:hypothetical protein [Acidobacteriota bacterium]